MLVPAIRVMFLNPKTRYCFAKTIAQLLMLRLSLCARAAGKIQILQLNISFSMCTWARLFWTTSILSTIILDNKHTQHDYFGQQAYNTIILDNKHIQHDYFGQQAHLARLFWTASTLSTIILDSKHTQHDYFGQQAHLARLFWTTYLARLFWTTTQHDYFEQRACLGTIILDNGHFCTLFRCVRGGGISLEYKKMVRLLVYYLAHLFSQ